ncbi:hypothetical protein JAAARDRAFT_44619 [Jaapia argillacea MUCL 33604]|uniref:SUN domain-containing protein n=1 Tax=Jaapia argillacea MUCL 33604 TaxID=933084 RepID=A0A067QF26_9AGAM|nr:hypothetical protein JAAARDRAFT_44619 [Jaapia argillacea MUCL 33604]
MLPATALSLMACLLSVASPVFSLYAPVLAPTTPFDQFRSIAAVKAAKARKLGEEEKICCLTPPEPVEGEEGEVLLSFEEWKAKKLVESGLGGSAVPSRGERVGASGGGAGTVNLSEAAGNSNIPSPSPGTGSPSPNVAQDLVDSNSELLSPHFRVPLTDRFNYAATDCSARVHTAHKSAKSPYSILSSKKDKYMLSPCAKPNSGERQFVVVELCDDIRIDTVQLANFEFFSGVFKDFSVSVAKTYSTDAKEGWIDAGTYRAKNVRGVQSFHPPTSLRDFYRYIRIDFHSHYGSEYYCPVSLLRVYGLTHLEQWKWDVWEAESRAREAEAAKAKLEFGVGVPSSVEGVQEAPKPADQPMVDGGDGEVASRVEEAPFTSSVAGRVVEPSANVGETPITHSQESVDLEVPRSTSIDTPSTSTILQNIHSTDTAGPDVTTSPLPDPRSVAQFAPDNGSSELPRTGSVNHEDGVDSSPPAEPTASFIQNPISSPLASPSSSSNASISHASSHTQTQSSLAPSHTSLTTLIPTPSPPVLSLAIPPPSSGGESIYRTIMNRLTALEANTTLYARYVEEQTAGVREVLRRLSEDVGRLEGIGKAQAQMYQRSLHEFERYRRRLEVEHRELLSRVNFLADEVVLEKRLGIAQLCLLLAVLVFMGLTRGSRGEALLDHGPSLLRKGTKESSSGMREWGKRTLSFSGDWVSRFRSRSPEPVGNGNVPAVKGTPGHSMTEKLAFPSRSSPPPIDEPRFVRRLNTNVASSSKLVPRPRTPSSGRNPRYTNHHRPATPTSSSHYTYQHHLSPRPLLQRANSHGPTHTAQSGLAGMGPVPRSAKGWARTAHLHQVKVAGRGKENELPREGRSLNQKGKGKEINVEGDDGLRLYPATADPTDMNSRHTQRDEGPSARPPSPISRILTANNESPPNHRQSYPESETDGDIWVDTDVDGSELDLSFGKAVDVFG